MAMIYFLFYYIILVVMLGRLEQHENLKSTKG